MRYLRWRWLSRWVVRNSLSTEKGLQFLVIQELSQLVVLIVFLPAAVAAAPSISGLFSVGFLAFGSLYFVLPMFGLLFMLTGGRGLLLRLEPLISDFCQLQVPTLQHHEALLLTGIVWKSRSHLWCDRGRLTLTERRLIFQRPRYFFLPPWRPGRIDEFGLDVVGAVDLRGGRGGLQLSLVPAAKGSRVLLRFWLQNGTKHDFISIEARLWRRSIHKALQAQVQGNYPVDV